MNQNEKISKEVHEKLKAVSKLCQENHIPHILMGAAANPKTGEMDSLFMLRGYSNNPELVWWYLGMMFDIEMGNCNHLPKPVDLLVGATKTLMREFYRLYSDGVFYIDDHGKLQPGVQLEKAESEGALRIEH